MNIAKKWLILIVIVLIPSYSVRAYDKNNDLVCEVFVKSGLEKQIKEIPGAMESGFDKALNEDADLEQMPKHILTEIRHLIGVSYRSDVISQAVLKQIQHHVSQDDLQSVLQWLDSPLGKKCVELEDAASTPEAFKEMDEFGRQLEKSPPAPERLRLLQEFDKAAKVTETAIEIAWNTQLGVALAIALATPSEHEVTLPEVGKELEAGRPQLEASVRADILVTLLYTYRPLTSAELVKYIQFSKSEASTRFNDAVIAGIKAAMMDCSTKWGKAVAEVIKAGAGATAI